MGGLLLLPALLAASAVPQPVEYNFQIARSKGVIYNPWTLSNDQVELRSFIGSEGAQGDFVAPTIRVAPGQQLRADFDRHESLGDSQGSESLIQNAGWDMEASMHGSASLDGFAHAAFVRD